MTDIFSDTTYEWVLRSTMVLCMASFGTYLTYRFYSRFKKRLKVKKKPVVGIFLEAIYWPFIIYIWFAALLYTVKNIALIKPYLPNIAEKSSQAGLSLFIILAFWRIIWIFEERYFTEPTTEQTSDHAVFHLISKLLRAGVIIVGTFIILSLLGMDITGMATGSTVIIGWAAKDVLADYFGTILLHTDEQFKVGNWIILTEKNIEGTVAYIGWRSTCIRAFDKKPHYIPNGLLSSTPIINASRMTHRRIYEDIALRHGDAKAIPTITQEVREMLYNDPDIANYQRIMIHLTEMTTNNLVLNLYAFTRTCDLNKYRNVKQKVLLKIIDIINRNSAQLARPIRKIYSQNDISPSS